MCKYFNFTYYYMCKYNTRVRQDDSITPMVGYFNVQEEENIGHF